MEGEPKIELSLVRRRYNEISEIWDPSDKWHAYTRVQIQGFLRRHLQIESTNGEQRILNAGSGGNDYDLVPELQVHADIADRKLGNTINSVVANTEALPFRNSSFDYCLCVGSVINYCDAAAVIAEFGRVLKPGGILLLEFENSRSLEYVFQPCFGRSATIVETFYQKCIERIWVYSEKYITRLIDASHFRVSDLHRFHIISPLLYRITKNPEFSSNFGRLDRWAKGIPLVRLCSSNVILACERMA